MIARGIWYLLVGWWLGAIWTILAYLFCLTIIGLPLGTIMFNTLPKVLTLKPKETEQIQTMVDGRPATVSGVPEEFPFLLRVLYFFLLGWHVAGYGILIGYILCLTILGLPAGLWILNRIPLLMTLKRAY